MSDSDFLADVAGRILNRGENITFDEARRLLSTDDIFSLASHANNITKKYNGNAIDVESLINAKSGTVQKIALFVLSHPSTKVVLLNILSYQKREY